MYVSKNGRMGGCELGQRGVIASLRTTFFASSSRVWSMTERCRPSQTFATRTRSGFSCRGAVVFFQEWVGRGFFPRVGGWGISEYCWSVGVFLPDFDLTSTERVTELVAELSGGLTRVGKVLPWAREVRVF